MPDIFSKHHIVAGENFNRWKVPVASVAIHLCIGAVYAWSIFNPPLTRSIGVGGSATPQQAYARIRAGASLVQLYSALVYDGPWLARRINAGLKALMTRDGVRTIAELVGSDG